MQTYSNFVPAMGRGLFAVKPGGLELGRQCGEAGQLGHRCKWELSEA